MLRVEVTLGRETPLARLAAVGDRGRLKVKQTAYVRNAAAYIRGIRRGKKCKKGRGNGNGIKGFISSAFLIGKQSGIGYNKN